MSSYYPANNEEDGESHSPQKENQKRIKIHKKNATPHAHTRNRVHL